ncbi:hypothetical protein P280DRAFT_503250 [Massarina eburnea CBS 473.64]|uniref:Uncharacterized protein n=1 Tax=Massarina eburnea CBS 473.64 TaxID=1395130 RepID=A0A6A6SFP9_9PLEO|nr:hypothetical protein P280DRAFT_503250 [Massarina eburnea CBS 473.64]
MEVIPWTWSPSMHLTAENCTQIYDVIVPMKLSPYAVLYSGDDSSRRDAFQRLISTSGHIKQVEKLWTATLILGVERHFALDFKDLAKEYDCPIECFHAVATNTNCMCRRDTFHGLLDAIDNIRDTWGCDFWQKLARRGIYLPPVLTAGDLNFARGLLSCARCNTLEKFVSAMEPIVQDPLYSAYRQYEPAPGHRFVCRRDLVKMMKQMENINTPRNNRQLSESYAEGDSDIDYVGDDRAVIREGGSSVDSTTGGRDHVVVPEANPIIDHTEVPVKSSKISAGEHPPRRNVCGITRKRQRNESSSGQPQRFSVPRHHQYDSPRSRQDDTGPSTVTSLHNDRVEYTTADLGVFEVQKDLNAAVKAHKRAKQTLEEAQVELGKVRRFIASEILMLSETSKISVSDDKTLKRQLRDRIASTSVNIEDANEWSARILATNKFSRHFDRVRWDRTVAEDQSKLNDYNQALEKLTAAVSNADLAVAGLEATGSRWMELQSKWDDWVKGLAEWKPESP